MQKSRPTCVWSQSAEKGSAWRGRAKGDHLSPSGERGLKTKDWLAVVRVVMRGSDSPAADMCTQNP